MLFFYGINIKSPQHDTLSITKKLKKLINKLTEAVGPVLTEDIE